MALLGALLGALPDPSTTADSTEQNTEWTASHTLLVSNTSPGQTVYNDPTTFNQLQLFATVGEVPKRVATAIGYDGQPAALASQIEVTLDQQASALRISTTQDSADEAVTIADAFANQLTSYIAERQDSLREQRLSANLSRLEQLEAQIEDLQVEVVFNPDDAVAQAQLDALSRQYSVAFEQSELLQQDQGQLVLTTLESAQAIAQTPESTGLAAPRSRVSRGILGAVVGAIAGIAVALVLAQFDKRIRSRAQAEQLLNLRAQVSIPVAPAEATKKVVVEPGRHDTLTDAYRTLRSVVGFLEGGKAREEGRAPIILVVSPGPGDGKTSLSANLAAAYVETGARTVAVNTDFRRPGLSQRILERRPEPQAFELAELATMPPQFLLTKTDRSGLVLFDLAGMEGSPGDLARVTAKALPAVARLADAVVVDTSPVGATAEVLELVPLADVIVIAVRVNHTSIDSASRTIEILRALTQAHLLLVMVGEQPERMDYYYEYAAKGAKPTRRERKDAKRLRKAEEVGPAGAGTEASDPVGSKG
jgi:Mrp family chromosome partitioning ATPase